MREQDSRFTREMPGDVLDEQWKLEKARILEEIYRNTRTNEGTEIRREQETAQSGPSTIEAVSRAAPELTEQQKKVYDALTGRPPKSQRDCTALRNERGGGDRPFV